MDISLLWERVEVIQRCCAMRGAAKPPFLRAQPAETVPVGLCPTGTNERKAFVCGFAAPDKQMFS